MTAYLTEDLIIEPDTTHRSLVPSHTLRGIGVLVVTSRRTAPDLEARVNARRAKLSAELTGLRADTLRAARARDQLQEKLSDLAELIEEGVEGDWANLDETVERKLDHWLHV